MPGFSPVPTGSWPKLAFSYLSMRGLQTGCHGADCKQDRARRATLFVKPDAAAEIADARDIGFLADRSGAARARPVVAHRGDLALAHRVHGVEDLLAERRAIALGGKPQVLADRL